MTQNDLATIRGTLASLRAKIRRAWAVRGVAITAAALSVAAIFSFGLDYFLDLPLAVRAVHLGLVIVAMGFVVRWALLRPLATPTTEMDLAQAVEHGAPDLRDRLVSALDFEQRLSDPQEPESRELMASIVRDAASHAARLDAGLLVDSRPARRALALAAAATAALAIVAICNADDFSLWLRRGVLLSDVSWPRRTHIVVIDFPANAPRIVTRGEDLHVIAVVEGDRPSELILHFEELADPDPAKPDAAPDVTATGTFRMYPVDGDEARYGYDFRSVSASFRFHVTGGDDLDELPLYQVHALVAPRVASISGKIVYPSYAGLPDGEVRDANFEVLKGSQVEMALTANMPLASARIIPADVTAPTVVPLSADGRSMTLKFEVTNPVDFHLELTAREGQTNRADDDVFHLRPADDRAPELRVLYPPTRLYRTPNGLVPIKFVAKDDFQVAKITLGVALGTTPLGEQTLWPLAEGPAKPADGKRVDAYRPLDLMQFAGDKGPHLKPGDVMHLTLRATDSRGNETSSGDLAVEVLSPEDFERRLSQRQGTLREALLVLKRGQQRSRLAIAELRELVAKGGPPDAASLTRGRDLQVDQGRVGNELAQFLGGIHQVFDGYVLDRVGAGTTIDKLLPLYHEALARPSDDEVFPAALYKKIVAEKRADHVYDPDVLGALLDIMDLGDRAVSEVSPSVYKSLVAWSGEPAHDAAELDRAEKAATELAALIVAIDQRMQRWGDLNILIEAARDIRAIEHDIHESPAGTKGLAPPK